MDFLLSAHEESPDAKDEAEGRGTLITCHIKELFNNQTKEKEQDIFEAVFHKF